MAAKRQSIKNCLLEILVMGRLAMASPEKIKGAHGQ